VHKEILLVYKRWARNLLGVWYWARHRCWWHRWGTMALTDHGTLSGALHHIVACRKVGILPITGVEAYFRPNRLIAKKFKQREAWHLCLFAKNLKGWHNLLEIVSTAFQDPEDGGGFYQYPCVDIELLRKHREGLACSALPASRRYLVELIIRAATPWRSTDYIDQMLSIFGEDFWIEIMPHDFHDQRTLNLELVNIAMERSIPLLATNDAHFPKKEWAETQRSPRCVVSTRPSRRLPRSWRRARPSIWPI
jgi:DNA polymerase-3 subunit alpha